MPILLVTASDTGVGKTRVVGALARLLCEEGAQVQVVKVVEPDKSRKAGLRGDALTAQRLSGNAVIAYTLAEFSVNIARVVAGADEHPHSFDDLVAKTEALPPCDWRILEGVGGIATPIDEAGRDWGDFAVAVGASGTIIVVPDRLGAINQARLAYARAAQCGLQATVWLNACVPVNSTVSSATRAGLRATGVPVIADQIHEALLPAQPEIVRAHLLELTKSKPLELGVPGNPSGADFSQDPPNGSALPERCRLALEARGRLGTRGFLTMSARDESLNLADSDYLSLSRDPFVADAVSIAVRTHGTSASASPLVTGWREPHEQLIEQLCRWHGFPCGLLWNSGYAANSAVLGLLPGRGDVVFVDCQAHHGMTTGLMRSGARLRRYEHLNLFHLEELLVQTKNSGRTIFVATESVFGMDGDYPDLVRLAKLKDEYGFHLIVDEAHAVGWYGPGGAGLVRAAGIENAVDILIGTLGKTLASGGAYTLFREPDVRDFIVNGAGEFIYSNALPPANAAAAVAALARVKELASEQKEWHECSRYFRAWLQAEGWETPSGDSPVVPVRLQHPEAAWSLAGALRETGVVAVAVRPPTVAAGTSRLRFSLKRTFCDEEVIRVLAAMAEWRGGR